jgi:glycine cleavage system H protein
MNTRVPMDLYYTNDHTWVLVEDNIGTIGITDYGQRELAEIVYINLPDLGTEVIQGSPFGYVEAMKTVAELISPLSGEVIEVNDSLEDDPRQANVDPYGDGWIIKIKIHEPDEVDNILTPHDYIIYVEEI